MGHASEVREIKSAGKDHVCSWCDEKIEIGQSYFRWRWYDYSDASTCKMHPECYGAMSEVMKDWDYEFEIGGNPRGCNCGFTSDCGRCNQRIINTSGNVAA